MEHLIKAFKKAGLTLRMLTEPLAAGSPEVFGMDIQRVGKNNEVFRIWPGGEDNHVQVLNIDKSISQLILLVKEDERSFWVDVRNASGYKSRFKGNWKAKYLEDHNLKSGMLREVGTKVQIQQKTPSEKRHFLMGVDERQLFIAQCPRGVTTVKDAHESLKAPKLILEEGPQRGRTIRQGEWFFLNVTPEEQELIDTKVSQHLVERLVPIGGAVGARFGSTRGFAGGGNPHMAEEVVVAPELNKVRSREVFVRGAIRHPDHKTIRFKAWRKVIRNAERVQDGVARMAGVNWID